VWDNLKVHLRAFTGAQAWLRVFRLPAYAPDLNPVEGIWSVLKRGVLANLAVASYAYLVQVIRQSGNLAVSGAVLAHWCLTTRPPGPCLAGS
jgi:transposase